jgi:hypothetical protein
MRRCGDAQKGWSWRRCFWAGRAVELVLSGRCQRSSKSKGGCASEGAYEDVVAAEAWLASQPTRDDGGYSGCLRALPCRHESECTRIQGQQQQPAVPMPSVRAGGPGGTALAHGAAAMIRGQHPHTSC